MKHHKDNHNAILKRKFTSVIIYDVLLIIESTHFPTWRFPYPAVTICPLNKVSFNVANDFSETLLRPYNISSEDILSALKETTALLGNREIDEEIEDKFAVLQKVIDYNNITILEFLHKLTPKCRDILQRCSWKGATTRCDTLFQRILTDSGHCCAFNYYGALNNTFTEKVSIFTPQNPRRVAGCGFQTALSVLFKTTPLDYYSSTFGTYGIRLLIHYSYDYPDENAPSKLVGPGMETFFAISPEMTYSTPGVARFPIKTRQCVFANERKPNVLSKYSYNNCLAECRGEIVYQLCGCIPYFYPNNGTRPTCNFTSVRCVNNARTYYASAFPIVNNTPCDCIPDCQHYTYPLELSTGKLVRTNSYNSLSFFKDVEVLNQSLAHIYFNDLVATRFRKDVYMNWHNLLASFGGLLGLFLGFSLVSGFEVIYFFTLRVFFDLMQKKKLSEPPPKFNWEQPGKDVGYRGDNENKKIDVKPSVAVKRIKNSKVAPTSQFNVKDKY